MAWRTVQVSNPARLSCKNGSVVIAQETGTASVPLEDIATLVIDNPQVTLTSQLLSACAERHVALISVGRTRLPNGIFLPFLPHSRGLKIMRAQLGMTLPSKKRLWQGIVRQKLLNQAELLVRTNHHDTAKQLQLLASRVRSGDRENLEAHGALIYFRALFGAEFKRELNIITNAALNYGYSIIRSAIARSLVGHGFLPAFGIHHSSEQNAFNLADDLLEPYRPSIDAAVHSLCPDLLSYDMLHTSTKSFLARMLHNDIPRVENGKSEDRSSMLALIDTTVISLWQSVQSGEPLLTLPGLPEFI